ncbi:shikimate kinase [candidate division NPL-UPA2 bacterium]|nr:shikimate kinase [candidate division NPL-UPA2 bacterium]
MKNIVLLGFMGTGKTAVGKKLARKLKMEYLDVDDLIEEEAGIPISEIFSRFGEERFRNLESKMVEKVSQYDNKVMATGGGIVLRKENMDSLRRNGILVCLTATPEVILERTKGEHHRPLLEVDYPLATIKELLKFRAPYYAQADYSLDTSSLTIDQVVEEVIKLVNPVR